MALPAAVLSVVVQAKGIAQTNAALAELDARGRQAAGGQDMAERAGSRLGNTAKRMASYAFVGGVAGALIGVVKAGVDFEQQMSSLQAVTGATSAQMKELRNQAINAGAATKYSAKDAAEAQTELAKGGMSLAAILHGGLKGALALAAAGEMDLGDAAATTVNALNLFQLGAGKATHVADAFAMAANATTADVSDFAYAMRAGGSAAHAAGLSFDQTTVWLEALAAAGIKGQDAGTSMKSALVQLAAPTKRAAKTAKELGLSFFDVHGNMKPLPAISQMLRDKLGGLTKQQQLHVAATLAGTDGMRGLLALMNAGPKTLDAYAAGLRKTGTAAAVAAKKQDNVAGWLEQLKGSLETLAIRLTSAALPAFKALLKVLTGIVNFIAASVLPVIGHLIALLVKIAPYLAPVVAAFLAWKAAMRVQAEIQALQDGMGALKAVFIAQTGITNASNLAILRYAATSKIAAAATWLMTTAQAALDAVLDANPIVLIVIAIAALVAAFILAYKKSATFRAIVAAVFGAVKAAGLAMWAGLQAAFHAIADAFTWLWGVLKTTAGAIVTGLTAAWTATRDAMIAVWDAIKTAAVTVFTALKDAVLAVWHAIDGPTRVIWTILSTFLKVIWITIRTVFEVALSLIYLAVVNAWKAIQAVTSAVWDAIKTALTVVWGVIKDAAAFWFGLVKAVVLPVWDAIRTATAAVWGAIKTALSAVWGVIKAVAVTEFNGMKTVVTAVWNAIKTVTNAIWVPLKAFLVGVWNGIKVVAGAVWTAIKVAIVNPIRGAWDTIKSVVGSMVGWLSDKWDTITSAVGRFAKNVGGAVLHGVVSIINTLIGWINDVIDVLNKLPFVNIGHIAKIQTGGKNNPPASHTVKGKNGKHLPGAARGAVVNQPMVMVGEEAPRHPEYVIPTNPAYRRRALGLFGSLGGKLGIPGFAQGGIIGFTGLESLWTRASGPRSMAALMAHIAQAESGGNPRARNSSGATGLWQILGQIVPGDLYDPFINALNAVAKWRTQGLSAWDASRAVWGRFASGAGGFFSGVGQRIAQPVVDAAALIRQLPKVTDLPDMVQPIGSKVHASAISYIRQAAGTGGGGTSMFDGKPVANWIIPDLRWARAHGWTGSVTSGFRTDAQQMAAARGYGLQHYGPGGPLASNHTKTAWPGGAVDVTGAAQLAAVLRGYHGAHNLVWGGPVIGDYVHFSATGHARGGLIGRGIPPFVGSYRNGGRVPQDGLAYVHKGEWVNRAGGNAPLIGQVVIHEAQGLSEDRIANKLAFLIEHV